MHKSLDEELLWRQLQSTEEFELALSHVQLHMKTVMFILQWNPKPILFFQKVIKRWNFHYWLEHDETGSKAKDQLHLPNLRMNSAHPMSV
jgi:hypothetical protein